MARSPALLLLLALGLCCPGIHGQSYRMTVRLRGSRTGHPRAGQRLELECQTSKEDSGVFWIRQDKDGILHFIVFINALSRTTFEGSQKTSTRFEGRKDNNFYQLVVKSFEQRDEGSYFCLMNINQALYFSSGLSVFFPAPTTTEPTAQEPTTQHGTTRKDPCLEASDAEQKEMNFFCDIFIWVPLAGACLLLLIALAITIILCQHTRRRRCRCKRPVHGKPKVKPAMPNRHV